MFLPCRVVSRQSSRQEGARTIVTRGHTLHREGMRILSLTSDSNHQPSISSTFLPVLLTADYPILTRQDVAWQGHIDLSLVKQPPL